MHIDHEKANVATNSRHRKYIDCSRKGYQTKNEGRREYKLSSKSRTLASLNITILKFAQIKGELEGLERTKDEETKKFQSHNIHFDFQILVKIKEAIVDVSSSCMELALKVVISVAKSLKSFTYILLKLSSFV